MGMPKGLIKIDHHTLLEHQLFCLNRFASKVILVLGFNNKKYFKKIGFLKLYHNKLKKLGNLKLFVTVNKTPKFGPFSSIQAGLKYLSTNAS
ncbi:MAG: nucleotidyltransferase family protein, partial [Bdellovibrio sp.]|nr:nucleotidyltransferase family protein [Bdellovibrio sp.]